MQVLIVIDMQNGVFATPRYQPESVTERINQLIDAADQTIFIQHTDADMLPDSEAWQVLPSLHRPANAISVTKTACDAFYRTELAQILDRLQVRHFTLCGCATDYCVDATIKKCRQPWLCANGGR
ncbi:hypothetical protein DZS_14960 [Dickeya ananatis]